MADIIARMYSKCCNSYAYNDEIDDVEIHGMPTFVGTCLECNDNVEFSPIEWEEDDEDNEIMEAM